MLFRDKPRPGAGSAGESSGRRRAHLSAGREQLWRDWGSSASRSRRRLRSPAFTRARRARGLGALTTHSLVPASAGAQAPITVKLALLSPPAVILSGDVRQDTPELRFHLDHAGGVHPPIRATVRFARVAGARRAPGARICVRSAGRAKPVEWRAQSRGNIVGEQSGALPASLSELCERPEQLAYDSALSSSRIAVRRAGLFVAGDLGVALTEAAADGRHFA